MMNDDIIPVITIDGTSGTGKGTMASLIAMRLGWRLLDSGAIYRLHALKALDSGVELDDEAALLGLAKTLDINFEYQQDIAEISAFLEGEDVTAKIRTEAVGMAASKTSIYQSVRTALMQKQRACVKKPGLVADGRDMGSVVFPEAQVKFYLDASCKERAKRRQKQLQERGVDVKFAGLLEEIVERDHRDKTRSVSPLVVPDGAVVINTDDLSIEQVFDHMMAVIKRQLG